MLTLIMKCLSLPVLLAATIWHPAGGYAVLVQFLVSAAATAVAVQSWRIGNRIALGLFAVIALLFNPVIPIVFSRGVFVPVGLLCMALFITSLIVLKDKPRPSIASITDRTPGSLSL